MNTRIPSIPSWPRLAPLATAALLVVGACNPPPPAQPEDASVAASGDGAQEADPSQELPAAEQVLEQGVVAIGGRELLDAIESYYSESRMEVTAQNIEASTKVWWKKGHFYSETDMPGVGMTRMWANADGVWSDDPINGHRKLEGKEARQAEWSTTLSLVADWQRFFVSAETTGRRTVDDMTLVDVLLTTEDGDEITLAFDEASGLLRQQLFKQESPMGLMPITVDIEDYQEIDGLKQPQRSVANMTVVDAVTTVEKFEINVDIDESKFQPPAEGA
jgi:hypothetical protein